MKWFVGAYAASPCHSEWNRNLETEYLDGLKKMSGIRGLELPFFGELHRHDPDWFLENLNPSWDYVLTCIPGTIETLKSSPAFGLASDSEEGRKEAIRFASKAREALVKIHQKLGRKAVVGVEIHSAPRPNGAEIRSSTEALARSFSELSQWDWEGATLFFEHCDRFIPGQVLAKGFLSLEEEILAIQTASLGRTPLQILINWGRSVIEARHPDGVISHLRLAREAGLLGGLIFSGCTPEDPLYGNFADTHAPFGGEAQDLWPISWMTLERVREALRLADVQKLAVVGFKIQALPRELSVAERLRKIQNWISFLNHA